MESVKYFWDTCIWIDFFRNKKFKYAKNIETLIFEERLYTSGIVIAELISGTRTKKETNIIEQTLSSLELIDTDYKVYVHAGFMRGEMKRKGITIPLTDALIACTCILSNCTLLSYDKHFKRIAEHYPLKLI